MNLTLTLKNWLIENVDSITKDSSDDEFKTAAAEAISSGKLTATKFAELTADPQEEEANEFSRKLDSVIEGIGKLTEAMTKANQPKEEPKSIDTDNKETVDSSNAPKLDKALTQALSTGGDAVDTDKDTNIKVKGAWEQYDTTKKALTYPTFNKAGRVVQNAGQQVRDFATRGRALDEPSEMEKAVAGAWAKLMILATTKCGGSRVLAYQRLNDHEKDLLQYGARNLEWTGFDGQGDSNYANIKGRLNDMQIKTIFDDTPSGGEEAVPIVFDDLVIQTPLLHGELFPLVNTIPIERGSSIEAVSTGTVTGTWTAGEATAITLFATGSYVAAFDTTIFRWSGSIAIGLDFMSDSPVDFASHVTAQYGERLMEDLDDVIATGSGSQPAGIQGAGTLVAFDDTTDVSKYETMRFTVAKAEHRSNIVNTAVFCANETSYQRAKAIPLGAADQRRVFAGLSTNTGTYDDYAIMGRPYKINESMANTQIFYAILARYRMYRRRGLTFRTSMEGDTLIRNSELLISATARYGGQLERAAAAAHTTDAPV